MVRSERSLLDNEEDAQRHIDELRRLHESGDIDAFHSLLSGLTGAQREKICVVLPMRCDISGAFDESCDRIEDQ